MAEGRVVVHPGPAAVRVVQEMREDAALQQLVNEAGIRAEFEAAVGRFTESVVPLRTTKRW